jgi:hypothetical protein
VMRSKEMILSNAGAKVFVSFISFIRPQHKESFYWSSNGFLCSARPISS